MLGPEGRGASRLNDQRLASCRAAQGVPTRGQSRPRDLVARLGHAAFDHRSERIDQSPLRPGVEGREHAAFDARSEWPLVNALGAVVERGVAQAGDQVVWSGLAPGWYALRSTAGSQALVVQP